LNKKRKKPENLLTKRALSKKNKKVGGRLCKVTLQMVLNWVTDKYKTPARGD
jgi:hypothetical protein